MDNQNPVEASCVDKDCLLILDAVRRLKEGTWHLCGEDSEWADHLIPIIKEALNDHINFENSCVMPGLSVALAQEHSEEHSRILALLNALDDARQKRVAHHFKALLGLLLDRLERHHQKFGWHHTSSKVCPNQNAIIKILRRSEGLNLESK